MREVSGFRKPSIPRTADGNDSGSDIEDQLATKLKELTGAESLNENYPKAVIYFPNVAQEIQLSPQITVR
jgi:hypothetical protein